ncbi:hypothetical protein E0Z10_g8060 [Xylaria hypoxylon]|uniref:tRNA(Ile)-lysidine synthetase n=1 Tax=Xylaria hypoxylon TaxID=37992 RepID=A0A4Z0YA07_9PEZI|nr:hypothetical protein E0Z10_g8060 [Xylaria hypoxylon]
MGTLSHVFHTGARPISVYEFAEALRAICPPRFPTEGRNLERDVVLAVSGGVDSMALAYLCTRLKINNRNFRVSDNPVASFRALVIDHQLREGSTEEAHAVANAVRQMGMTSDVDSISWSRAGVPGKYRHPKDLPNFESVARRLRYQKLGHICGTRRLASLLLGHHEDDQYETVLMRLLLGHGVRGLRGMRAAADIPECEGLHGVHHSGYLDDQREAKPFYNNTMSRKQFQTLRDELRANIDRHMHEEELRDSIMDRLNENDFEELYQTKRVVPLEFTNIDVEDGGVMIYRPLLEFSKDRLIATCEANGIPWWEDSTNQDQTLTPRNAVRHMYKNYTLPVALRKPSILALSRRCEQRAQALEAEANRLMAHTIIHDMESNVGTASVQFPVYTLSRFSRDMSPPPRRRARILRQREVAGLLIQKIIALVTPEKQIIPLANLQNFISRLFPALSNTPDEQNATEPPKAFAIAGVYFVPIEQSSPSSKGAPSQRSGASIIWYLSRTPYPSSQPIPRYRATFWSTQGSWRGFSETSSKWSPWMRWALWDGRFWIRLRHRLPYRVIIQPFERSHAKSFRESLPAEDRYRLGVLLKRYAPGKTRFTLPALYFEEDLDLNNVRPRRFYPLSPRLLQNYQMGGGSGNTADPVSDHPRTLDVGKMKLVALPSLGVQIPRLEDWLEFEIRYRCIDRGTLDTAGSFHRGSFVSSRSLPTPVANLARRRAFRSRRREAGHRGRMRDRSKRVV